MTKIQLELVTNIDMLVMIKSGIRVGICVSVPCQAETKNRCMKRNQN